MRTWLSLLVIVFSVLALGAGYISGRSSMAPARSLLHPLVPMADVPMPAPAVFARSLHGAHSFNEADAATLESADAAVVANTPGTGTLADDASVALVIEDAGPSLKLEAGFLNFSVPLTLAIDPAADEAVAVAAAAYERGKTVYVELLLSAGVDGDALKIRIDKLRRAIPSMSGVAVRFSDENQVHQAAVLGQVLRSENLRVLDLTGIDRDAQRKLTSAGISNRRRDITIDNREESGYVRFMLAQAIQVARGRGMAVIVAHPNPESYAALSSLLAKSVIDGVDFKPL